MIAEGLEKMNAEIEVEEIIGNETGEVAILPVTSDHVLDLFMSGLVRCMADFKVRTETDQDMGDAYMQIRSGIDRGMGVWLAVRKSDRAVVGYLVAHETNTVAVGKECFIWQAYAMEGNIFELGWAFLDRWARARGCLKIYFLTSRDEDAMIRKLAPLGFKKKSTLFEVKLNG